MGKIDVQLQILNLQGKNTRAISFHHRSNFQASGQLDLQVITIIFHALFSQVPSFPFPLVIDSLPANLKSL